MHNEEFKPSIAGYFQMIGMLLKFGALLALLFVVLAVLAFNAYIACILIGHFLIVFDFLDEWRFYRFLDTYTLDVLITWLGWVCLGLFGIVAAFILIIPPLMLMVAIVARPFVAWYLSWRYRERQAPSRSARNLIRTTPESEKRSWVLTLALYILSILSSSAVACLIGAFLLLLHITGLKTLAGLLLGLPIGYLLAGISGHTDSPPRLERLIYRYKSRKPRNEPERRHRYVAWAGSLLWLLTMLSTGEDLSLWLVFGPSFLLGLWARPLLIRRQWAGLHPHMQRTATSG